jgi:hypothetical protein
MKDLLRDNRGLSTVTAVLLLSVTIVVVVSAAYWMGTIASSYTAFEQIELPTSYTEFVSDLFNPDSGIYVDGWKVHIELKNTGSADSAINNIFLNAKPLKDYKKLETGVDKDTIKVFTTDGYPLTQVPLDAISVSVQRGGTIRLIIWIMGQGNVPGCSSGTRIDLKFHSAAGMDYPVQVKLL